MQYAVFLLVGPDQDELSRLHDLFEALACHEADSLDHCDLFLANDGNAWLDDEDFGQYGFDHIECFANPGRGTTPDVWDRHINGMFAALQRVRGDRYDFLLKLDTDALVIAPFAQRLRSFFNRYPRAGSLGTHLHFPCGKLRPGNLTIAPRIKDALQPVPVPSLLEAAKDFEPYAQRLRDTMQERQQIIQAAQQHGYFGSQHVQGGGYALSGNFLKSLARNRLPVSTDVFNGTGLGEDVSTALLVKALGFELMDYNHPGEVFGVWWQQIELPLQELLDRQYAVIHSIKDLEDQSERDIRRFFKQHRDTVA